MSREKTVNTAELLTWSVDLLRVVPPEEAERLSSLDRDTLQRNHGDKVVRLSKRRVGMRVGHALMLRPELIQTLAAAAHLATRVSLRRFRARFFSVWYPSPKSVIGASKPEKSSTKSTSKTGIRSDRGRHQTPWSAAVIAQRIEAKNRAALKAHFVGPNRTGGVRLRVLGPAASKPAPQPAPKPAAATEAPPWPEEEGDPGPEFTEAAE